MIQSAGLSSPDWLVMYAIKEHRLASSVHSILNTLVPNNVIKILQFFIGRFFLQFFIGRFFSPIFHRQIFSPIFHWQIFSLPVRSPRLMTAPRASACRAVAPHHYSTDLSKLRNCLQTNIGTSFISL